MNNAMPREAMLAEAFRLQRGRRLNRGAVSRLLKGHAEWASLEASREDNSPVKWVDALEYYAARLPDWGTMQFGPDLADVDIDKYFKATEGVKSSRDDEDRVGKKRKRAQATLSEEMLPPNSLAAKETGDICQVKYISDESSDDTLSPEKTPSVGDGQAVPENFTAVLSGLSPSLILRKKDYMPFVHVMKELQTDTSMEVGLRCIAELDILGTGRGKTVTIHPNPFIFDIHAGYKSGFRAKSRRAQRLVLLLKHDVPIPPATEWFVGALLLPGKSIGNVSHYVTVAIRNIGTVFTKVMEMQASSKGLPKTTDLAEAIGLDDPQVLILDSMTKAWGYARFESGFQFLYTLLYITWAKSKRETAKVMKTRSCLKYEYSRDNAVTELDEMELKVLESAWKPVAHFYKTSMVLVNGPQPPGGVDCGYYVQTHVAKSLKDGYLNGVADKAARVVQRSNDTRRKKNKGMHLVSSRQRWLFTHDDVSETFTKITNWVMENVKSTTVDNCSGESSDTLYVKR